MKKPTTLITGAGVRVGAHIAKHLAACGHDLVLHYHNSKTQAEALAEDLRRAHATTVTLLQADLENAQDISTFWNGLPPVTNLINNAARFMRDDITHFSAPALRAHIATNFEAPLLLSQGYMAQLPEGDGNIIMLGDGNKRWSISPQFFTYAASKLALESVIDLLAASVAPRVRANIIALAPTIPGTEDSEETYKRLAAHAPLARNSNFTEVCTAIDFLLASPGITGQTISLAGGFGLTTHRSTPY